MCTVSKKLLFPERVKQLLQSEIQLFHYNTTIHYYMYMCQTKKLTNSQQKIYKTYTNCLGDFWHLKTNVVEIALGSIATTAVASNDPYTQKQVTQTRHNIFLFLPLYIAIYKFFEHTIASMTYPGFEPGLSAWQRPLVLITPAGGI